MFSKYNTGCYKDNIKQLKCYNINPQALKWNVKYELKFFLFNDRLDLFTLISTKFYFSQIQFSST